MRENLTQALVSEGIKEVLLEEKLGMVMQRTCFFHARLLRGLQASVTAKLALWMEGKKVGRCPGVKTQRLWCSVKQLRNPASKSRSLRAKEGKPEGKASPGKQLLFLA